MFPARSLRTRSFRGPRAAREPGTHAHRRIKSGPRFAAGQPRSVVPGLRVRACVAPWNDQLVCLLRRDRLQRAYRQRLDLRFVPRTRETAAADLVAREDVVIDRPLAARQFVEHLDAIAVGVAQVDAERDAVIGDVVDLDALGLDAVIELLQIVETLEPPGHVV